MHSVTPVSWDEALFGLNESEAMAIEESCSKVRLADRSIIFSNGEAAKEMFVVADGRVKLMYYSIGGSTFTAGVWGNGYIIGLVSCYLGENRFLSGVAVGEAELITLSRERLLDLMMSIPRFSLNIARILARQASACMRRRGAMALDSVVVRICKILMDLVANEQDSQAIIRGLSQDELAEMAGASRVWVNHVLGGLERDGVILRRKREIAVLDIGRLERFADEL